MSHEVESMFSVKETPWHKLGTVVQEAPNAEQAIELAGLNWKVEKKPLLFQHDNNGVETDFYGLVRETDQKCYGVVKNQYTVLQNSESFDFFNPFIESGLARFETAGALHDGVNVWILASLNKAPLEIVEGDYVVKYLLLSNNHSGKRAVRVGFTPVRVVCANTLMMAMNSKQSSLMRVQHSKSVVSDIEKLRDIVNIADAQFEATGEQYRKLAHTNINQEDLKKFVKMVFFSSAKHENRGETERQKVLIEKMNETIQNLFEAGKGAELHRGTAWGLYNAATEYLSYGSGKDDSSRLNSLWFGKNQEVNLRAFQAARSFVA